MIPLRFSSFDGVERADLVVVGTGVAGLSCALAAAPARVALMCKDTLLSGGSTRLAQGGIAAALGQDDDPSRHARDTERVAAGLADPDAVDVLTRGAVAEIPRLIALGAGFDRQPDGELARGREAGHGRDRILHAGGDATGREISRALAAACRAEESIRVHERTFAWDLIVDGGRVIGVVAIGPEGERLLFLAPAVVLATGGFAGAWSRTTNPPGNTGDGLAIAARAGARLADLELVQFHPTALAVGTDPMPLVTEALRGRGAIIIDEAGRRFLLADHPDGELAPRDVVARAIRRQLDAGHGVLLDTRQAVGEAFPRQFPTVWRLCQEHGLDPRRESLPVSPAAHYCMGGILVDVDGRSSLPGLWACGEAAATGVHGGNRLASNSLLEGLVFGRRVAHDILKRPARRFAPGAGDVASRGLAQALGRPAVFRPGAIRLASLPAMPCDASRRGGEELIKSLRAVMWKDAGLVRNDRGLTRVLGELERLAAEAPPEAGELRNLLAAGRLVVTAALARTESRGAHFRSDAPQADPARCRRLVLTVPQWAGGRERDGEASVRIHIETVAPSAETRREAVG
ncbi:MAG: L-aspartate oxidase [Thermoanaerobaculia bacterium]